MVLPANSELYGDMSDRMVSQDSINQKHGRGTLHLASAGTAGKHRTWVMKQQRRTPGYTTDWMSLKVAR